MIVAVFRIVVVTETVAVNLKFAYRNFLQRSCQRKLLRAQLLATNSIVPQDAMKFKTSSFSISSLLKQKRTPQVEGGVLRSHGAQEKGLDSMGLGKRDQVPLMLQFLGRSYLKSSESKAHARTPEAKLTWRKFESSERGKRGWSSRDEPN